MASLASEMSCRWMITVRGTAEAVQTLLFFPPTHTKKDLVVQPFIKRKSTGMYKSFQFIEFNSVKVSLSSL